MSRFQEAMSAARSHPDKALAIARTIPLPARQADVVEWITRSVAEKDASTAKSVLNQCRSMLEDIKDPEDRVDAWPALAEAAWKIKDEQSAWEAIDRGMADAAAIYKLDADADSPNTALRDHWPSTQAYRAIIACAAKMFGVDAAPLLFKIHDPDLALLAQIEMAAALLGRPGRYPLTSTQRMRKK